LCVARGGVGLGIGERVGKVRQGTTSVAAAYVVDYATHCG
jgi:hypothetical protein